MHAILRHQHDDGVADLIGPGFGSPMWMNFRQDSELTAHVRKFENNSLVVYANLHYSHGRGQGWRGERARDSLHERSYRLQRRAN